MVLKDSELDLQRRKSCHDNAPNGGWGWMVTFSGFMASLILDGISYSFGIFFPELLDYFNDSRTLTSLIISVFNGTYLGIGELFNFVSVTSLKVIFPSLNHGHSPPDAH